MSGRPRIAALGGGTGLATVLRALKTEDCDITAIVTVADDGGSSGRLNRDLGVLPPGDIRNCLVALADDESLMGRLFQHRFVDGDLAGHPFGNLFLAALAEVTGNFDRAIEECSHVLKISGRVLPTTLEHTRLWAERDDGSTVCGETQIGSGVGACRRVWLDPVPIGHPPAVDAIMGADLVLLGPGSLFTSVLPHLAVPEIAAALRDTTAVRAYIGNVMTQPGETEGFTAADHVRAVIAATDGALDVAVLHGGTLNADAVRRYHAQRQEPVPVDVDALGRLGVSIVTRTLAAEGDVVRHDPASLAAAICEILDRSERTFTRLRHLQPSPGSA